MVEERGGERFFQYILYPPAVKPAQTFSRELVFVVDVSGSMRGFPLKQSKKVMEQLLRQMAPGERFQVITFAHQAQSLFAQAMPATPKNIQQALEFVDLQQGGGGTHFMAAIDQIFPPHQEAITSDRQKVVLFLTDGYIGNEQEIILSIRDRAQGNRVFTLGVDNSVNHYLLKGMAEAGAGVHAVIRTDGDSERAMREFYARASAPLLTGFELQGSGLDLSEVFPKRVAHLTAGRPVQVKALARLPNGTLWQNTVNPVMVGNVGFPSLWARKKGAHIQLFEGAIDGREVVLQYQILTPYTSFVAVEEWVTNKDFENEIIKALKRWRWKTISQGEVVVQVPLEFRCHEKPNP